MVIPQFITEAYFLSKDYFFRLYKEHETVEEINAKLLRIILLNTEWMVESEEAKNLVYMKCWLEWVIRRQMTMKPNKVYPVKITPTTHEKTVYILIALVVILSIVLIVL